MSFDGLRALAGVELTVSPGEILGLIGPNGAGKTTLMNVITGFQRPDRGHVALGERDITGLPAERVARAGIGRTFQGVRLFGDLSVRENVELGALVQARRRSAVATHVDEVLEALELLPVAERRGRELPFGLERTVALARAIAAAPRYLLLDEPAAGLNENETEQLRTALRVVQSRLDCALVVIDHDVGLILSLCGRIHVLDHGTTIAEGSPDEVRSDPAVIEAYLGTSHGASVA